VVGIDNVVGMAGVDYWSGLIGDVGDAEDFGDRNCFSDEKMAKCMSSH